LSRVDGPVPHTCPADGDSALRPAGRAHADQGSHEELLEASTLCAVATVAARGRAHVNTAYFAWSPRLELFWLSDPCSRHSRNVRLRRKAVVLAAAAGSRTAYVINAELARGLLPVGDRDGGLA